MAGEIFEKMRTAVAAAGGEADYDLFYDQPADTPYDLGEHDPDRQILVIEPDGKVVPFSKLSSLPEALNRQLMFRRIHVDEHWHDVARAQLD